QARLAGIRRTNQHHPESVADNLRRAKTSDMDEDVLPKTSEVRDFPLGYRAGHIGLVSKIELRLDHRPGMQELSPPCRVEVALAALRVLHRQPALRFRFGADQVGQCFRA